MWTLKTVFLEAQPLAVLVWTALTKVMKCHLGDRRKSLLRRRGRIKATQNLHCQNC